MAKKLAALVVGLAAAWLLSGLLVEPFIGWYSGVEQPVSVRAWIDWGLQLFVDVAAIWLGWRGIVGAPAGRVACRRCGSSTTTPNSTRSR